MTKKRINGEGNIRKRTDRSWEGSVLIEDKRRYVYGKSRGEVKDKINELLADGPVEDNDITVADWMDTWVECYTAKTKTSTQERYRQDIRCHIKPELGHRLLQDVTMPMVQRFLNKCQKVDRLSEKSLKNIYLVLNKAMNTAQKTGLIRRNPCADAEIPAYDAPHQEMRPLKDGEIKTFLQLIVGHPLEALFFVAVFTGMRQSEIIGLTWDCVDFDSGQIHLYRQYKAVRGQSNTYAFTNLKNKQDRTFTATSSVMQTLRRVKAKQAEWKIRHGPLYNNATGFVFSNELGGHLSTRTVQNQFKEIVIKMGLPQVRFHDLRHTYATLALQNGVDIKTISYYLGHSTVAFTMDKYMHVTMNMQQDGAQKIESFIQSL